MKELTFLKKLKRKGIIELVGPSEEMKSSYLIKAENCFKSARILFQSQLYENSTSEAYYCMYNSLLALLFKVGIKSENHSASITVFKKLFDNNDLFKIISWAKKERIDKQYYVETKQIIKASRESCNEMIIKSEDFLIKMRVLIDQIGTEKIDILRNCFENLFK